MSKEIGDQTFQFLCIHYAMAVQNFLDDPDGCCGPDAKEIAEHTEYLIGVGDDIQLIADSDADKMDFWAVAARESTPYEIQRLKDYLKEAASVP